LGGAEQGRYRDFGVNRALVCGIEGLGGARWRAALCAPPVQEQGIGSQLLGTGVGCGHGGRMCHARISSRKKQLRRDMDVEVAAAL
jgi:hypothetical protein